MLNRIRRFGFRLLYKECALAYDTVSRAVSLGRWRSWQRAVMPFLPEPDAGLVLELAHGTGDLQLDLINAGYRAIALDRSRSMGRLARRKLCQGGLSAHLIQGEAARLPLASHSVAALVCTFPTSFIVEHRTLAEIERVLQSDATAVIVLSGLLTGDGLRARLIRCLYWLSGQACRQSTDEEIRAMFQASGLSAEARALSMNGSLAQLALLTKRAAAACDDHNREW